MTSENRGAGQGLERTGAASKEAADLKVEEEAIVEAVPQAAEFTGDGRIKYVQYKQTEDAFHDRIVESMYMASLNEPEDPPEPTAKEKCIHRCFQSIHCNISRCFSRRCFSRRRDPDSEPAIEMIDYMTPILRRGRSKGWVIQKNLIPDIVKESCRNWWVGFELCTVIIAFVLSIASFSLGKNRIFNILHLALTILGTILAVTDGVILLYGGSLFKKCGACYNHVPQNDGEEDPSNDGKIEKNGGKCKRCIATTRSTFDFVRMLLSELLFYPLLICDIFEVVTGKAYLFSNITDGISFTLFGISSLSLLFYVYIVRIIILIVGIIHSEKKRKPQNKDEKETQTQFPDYDPAIRKAAKYFQIYFVCHVAAQMVAQILMIIAIGAKIRDDNSHLFENTTNIKETSLNSTVNTTKIVAIESDSIHVSGTLWYMLVAGYVLPIIGLLTFFVVTYFWVQEFPIGFCIDVLSVLKAPDIDDIKDFRKTKKDAASKLEKIKQFVHIAELKKQFKDLRLKAFYRKFLYPFFTPQMVIICLIYAFLQFSFIICAGNSTSGNGPLGGGHWTTFYVIAAFVGYIANFYVFIVASAWFITIIAVIISTAILIYFILPFCCCFLIMAPFSNNQQRY